MNITALGDVFKAMLKKNYKVYSRPYELNIVGIRSAVNKPNKFDDVFFIFYKNDKNQIIYKIFPCTTDPGTFWLNHPMNPLGTAAVKAGQYIDAYSIGLHNSKYSALVQTGKLKVYRDLDRNSLFDFESAKEYTSSGDGINIHKAGAGAMENVDKWSAGCQVFKSTKDFDEFMLAAKKHRDLYGNKFTYTLLDEREDFKKKNRGIAAVGIGALLLVAGYKFLK
jgi:hypothetical protein